MVALGQPGQFGVDYNDANTGFAKGKSVFYVQGIWTLPVIRQTNPKILVRSFVFPATNSPRQTKMVSGVDSLLTVANSGNTAKTDAAIRFIDFLLQPKQAAEYAKVAGLFAKVRYPRIKVCSHCSSNLMPCTSSLLLINKTVVRLAARFMRQIAGFATSSYLLIQWNREIHDRRQEGDWDESRRTPARTDAASI